MSDELINSYIGRTFYEFKALCIRHQYTVRIVKLDGEDVICTAEFRPSRINVGVSNNIVTEFFGKY